MKANSYSGITESDVSNGSNLMQQGDPLVQKLNAEIKRKDAEIRELVAALDEIEQGRCARINRHGYGDCGAEGIVAMALAKAKAAGYEP